MEVDYSFIILCYNQMQQVKVALKTLLKTVKQLSTKSEIEIIVVDNGSQENIRELVDQFNTKRDIELHYFRIKENMGYPVGMNMGISKSKGKVVVILNSDLIFSDGWLNSLILTLQNNEDIGVVAPCLSNATGLQHIGFYETDYLRIDQFAQEFMNSREFKVSFTDRVIGACMVIKREVIDKVGGNDFWFGAGYYDDDDWCLRIKQAGYLIGVQNNSFVYHIGGGSFGSANLNVQQLIKCNKEKFSNKWESNNLKSEVDMSYSHYIPIEENFQDIEVDKDPQRDEYLIVADWFNLESKWCEKVETLLKKSDQEHYYAWLPKNYFKCCFNNQRRLRWMNEVVPHVLLLKFIGGFKGVVAIENDYINRYIVYLADKLNVNII